MQGVYVANWSGHRGVVCIDCEMMFTSQNFEHVLVMVVAVSRHLLLYKYVKLQDHVFDNTQFSGIMVQHMAARNERYI